MVLNHYFFSSLTTFLKNDMINVKDGDYMAKIRVMDENLANKIAAGEVVERVVSIVKELIENAIDADSDEITIELKESGLREIKITDNGITIPKFHHIS